MTAIEQHQQRADDILAGIDRRNAGTDTMSATTTDEFDFDRIAASAARNMQSELLAITAAGDTPEVVDRPGKIEVDPGGASGSTDETDANLKWINQNWTAINPTVRNLLIALIHQATKIDTGGDGVGYLNANWTRISKVLQNIVVEIIRTVGTVK